MQANNNFQGRDRRKFLFIPFVTGAVVLALGAAVMWLWNAILPALLHVAAITYWQAVGLLVLCRILFGGFGRGFGGGRRMMDGRGRGPGGAMREKWMAMSDEERRAFKERWRKRCDGRRG